MATYFGILPTYTSVHDITLEDLKKRAKKIHYFGLGFIQIKLNNHERVHFYTTTLPPIVDMEEVHDHRYDFYSFVLSGVYHHELFELREGSTHVLTEETCVDPNVITTKPSKTLHETPSHPCSIIKTGEVWMKEGSHYFIEKNVLHRVSTENAITFLIRESPTKERARVVYKEGAPRVCPFRDIVSEELLWDIVAQELKKAKVQKTITK